MNYAVILAGGKGERFWPKSRINKPKQLQKILSDKKLLEETIDRIEPLIHTDYVRIVTTEYLAGQIIKLIDKINIPNIISEPAGKNTAQAIALAASKIMAEDPEAVMVILSSDHRINDETAFRNNIQYAIDTAKKENEWVIFGIKPNYPETGYGYIELGKDLDSDVLYEVETFKEKPDKKTAEYFFDTKRYLWNSGIFVAQVKTIWKSFEKYLPETFNAFCEIMNKPNDYALLKKKYNNLEKISIDYAILEKLKRVLVVKATFDWDDMGSWLSMERHLPKDENNNVSLGDVSQFDTKDSVLISYDGVIGSVGLENVIVIRDKDAVLVCNKNQINKIPSLLKLMDEKYK